jgi:hypothetical protein
MSQVNLAVSPGLSDPNYVPPNRGPLVVGIILTLTILSFITVALRLYANKTFAGIGLGWEDYSIVVASVSIPLRLSFR